MITFRHWVFDRKTKEGSSAINFLALIEFDGTNIEEIRQLIKRANVGKIDVKQSDIGKRKQNTEFLKTVRGGDYDYIYLNKGDYVGLKKNEIYIFNADYVKTYFTADMKNNTLKSLKPED